MAYSLFLKVTMGAKHNTVDLIALAKRWTQYIICINANEGLPEKQLEQLFTDRMKEFYISGGIRLMERSDIDDFMRLLKNLRGGITQIVKRHAKIDLANHDNDSGLQSSIYYLDANNLYGGAMHRMMPNEHVGLPERGDNREYQSKSEQMGAIAQDIRHVRILHRVRYRGTNRIA